MEKSVDRSEYQRNYYQSRKEIRSEKRKLKYNEDPEYRAKAIERTKRYRDRKKQERQALIAAGVIPKRKKTEFVRQYIDIDGVKFTAFTIDELAEKVGRSSASIEKWYFSGLIPKTPFIGKRGERLFTDPMIRVVKSAVLLRGRVYVSDNSFREYVVNGWRECGVEVVDNQACKA